MRPLLAAILFSSSLGAAAQNTYTVCGVQEFCFCSQDGDQLSALLFSPCPDSVGLTMNLLFCAGEMTINHVLRSYNGPDENFATPLVSGSFPALSGLSIVSSTDTILLVFDMVELPGESCQAGGSMPWRGLAWLGDPDPAPVPGDCTGTDPFCLTTGLAAPRRQPGLTVRGRELVLPASLAHATRIDLFDASGRGVGGMRPQGRTTLALPASLGAGVYLAAVESGGMRSIARFVLSE